MINEKRIGDKRYFEQIFREHYERLCAYANQYLKDIDLAERFAKEVLMTLWAQRETIEISGDMKSYLLRAVRNKALKHLKHLKVLDTHK